ncbi:MAG: hypothetical protein V8S42_10415 [Lachnospiraceae bacterium]
MTDEESRAEITAKQEAGNAGEKVISALIGLTGAVARTARQSIPIRWSGKLCCSFQIAAGRQNW